MKRNLFTFSLALLAAFGMYTMGTDAADRVPGPIGGLLPGGEASHAPPAVPGFVNYQGRLVDTTTGNPLPDAVYSVRFSIHNAPTAGTELWFETQNVTTQDGVFSVLLGSSTVFPTAAFNTIPRYLQVKVGADAPLTPRQQFTTVPYAFFAGGAALANNAEQVDGLEGAQFLRSDISATQAANLTVAGNLVVNQATTLGNGAGSDPVIVNDTLTVNGQTQLGDALSDTTTITGPVNTLGNVVIDGDLTVDGNNIDNGTDAGDLRLDPNAAGANSLLLGGSTSAGDDVQVVDGGLCVGNSGCNVVPADGSLQVDGGGAFRSDTTFDADIAVGNDPAFDSTASITFGGGEAIIQWDTNDNDTPSFQISERVDVDGYLCVAVSVATCDTTVSGGLGSIVAENNITANAFDLAERFNTVEDDLVPGDLVMFGDSGALVRRTDGTPYDARIAGIVSGNPGFTLGWAQDDDAAVALQGRVPLNVTLENGQIAPGDYLTSSSTPGKAMRATEPGPIAGIALEAFDGSDVDGQVLTFVSLGERNVGALVERIERLEQRIATRGGNGTSGDAAVASADDGAPLWMMIAVATTFAALMSGIVVSYVSRRRSVS